MSDIFNFEKSPIEELRDLLPGSDNFGFGQDGQRHRAELSGDALCTITLTWSQALLVQGVFSFGLKRTQRNFECGLCSAADLENERAIARELQRQILFRLPPSTAKGGAS
jgi:hypothetical protein